MIHGFENEGAVFFVERQVDEEEDPYGETDAVVDWVPLQLADDEWGYLNGEVVYDEADIDPKRVRSEQQDAEYVREVYGDWPMEVYRLYVAPEDVGTIDNGEYELAIGADDRVELDGSEGWFAIQPPNIQRLDSSVPEYVQLEVTRIGV